MPRVRVAISQTSLITALVTIGAIGVAWWLFHRIENRQLFLFVLPWDRPPNAAELADALLSIQQFRIPALVSFLVMGVLFAVFARPRAAQEWQLAAERWRHLRRKLPWTLAAFAAITLMDLATTLAFCYRHGIDLEIHTAIRLMAYAFGRTAGPAMGKLLQAFGVVVIAAWIGKYAAVILWIAIAAVGMAAAFNFAQLQFA